MAIRFSTPIPQNFHQPSAVAWIACNATGVWSIQNNEISFDRSLDRTLFLNWYAKSGPRLSFEEAETMLPDGWWVRRLHRERPSQPWYCEVVPPDDHPAWEHNPPLVFERGVDAAEAVTKCVVEAMTRRTRYGD